jgi:hypothetical protein
MLAASFLPALAADRSHLICRGGGGSGISVLATKVGISATLSIERSKAPATFGLNAGECAWPDAVMEAGDPTLVVGDPTMLRVGVFPGAKANPVGTDAVVETLDGLPFLDFVTNASAYYAFDVQHQATNTFLLTGFQRTTDPKSPIGLKPNVQRTPNLVRPRGP